MQVDRFTRDHATVMQAAYAYRNDMPLYAEALLRECERPLLAAVELVGLLMQERVERMAEQS